MYTQFKNNNKVCGFKQVKKALKTGKVKEIYIAHDADKKMIDPVVEHCKSLFIPITVINSMEQLGKICDIDVGCSVAAVVE